MHGKLQRRILHGLGTKRQERQQPRQVLEDHWQEDTLYGGSDGTYHEPDSGSTLPITGPITIVVTRTISSPVHEEIVTDSPDSVFIPRPSSGYYTTVSRYPGTVIQTSSTQAPTSLVESSPVLSPTSTISITPNNGAGTQASSTNIPNPVSGATQPGSTLPSGAIIGIVIAGIALVVTLLIFVIRRRYVQRRINMRKEWTNSKYVKPSSEPKRSPESDGAPPFIVETRTSGSTPKSMREQQQQQPLVNGRLGRGPPVQMAQAKRSPLASTSSPNLPPLVIPPPASYGTDFSPIAATSKSISSAPYTPYTPYTPSSQTPKKANLINAKPQSASASAYYNPPSAVLSPPGLATVASTFIPALPDELQITVGETIRVVSEFDDGWAMCVDGRGEQGMVPLECLDQPGHGGSSGALGAEVWQNGSRGLGGNLKRISSLQPMSKGTGYGRVLTRF